MDFDWKQALKVVIIVLIILNLFSIVLRLVAYNYYSDMFRERPVVGTLGKDLQLFGVECAADSHYTLTIQNMGSDAYDLTGLDFYIDDEKVSCDGITILDAGELSKCTIHQPSASGHHQLDVLGPGFSMSRTIDCW